MSIFLGDFLAFLTVILALANAGLGAGFDAPCCLLGLALMKLRSWTSAFGGDEDLIKEGLASSSLYSKPQRKQNHLII